MEEEYLQTELFLIFLALAGGIKMVNLMRQGLEH